MSHVWGNRWFHAYAHSACLHARQRGVFIFIIIIINVFLTFFFFTFPKMLSNIIKILQLYVIAVMPWQVLLIKRGLKQPQVSSLSLGQLKHLFYSIWLILGTGAVDGVKTQKWHHHSSAPQPRGWKKPVVGAVHRSHGRHLKTEIVPENQPKGGVHLLFFVVQAKRQRWHLWQITCSEKWYLGNGCRCQCTQYSLVLHFLLNMHTNRATWRNQRVYFAHCPF